MVEYLLESYPDETQSITSRFIKVEDRNDDEEEELVFNFILFINLILN